MRRIRIQHDVAASDIEVMLVDGADEGSGHDAGPKSRDPLTGLPGIAELRARLAQAIAHAEDERTCVGLLSIVCDGARAGSPDTDAALTRELARRLRLHTGPGDFLALTGRRRFGLVLGRLEAAASAGRLAGALIHDLAQPFCLTRGAADETRACIGAAVWPSHGDDADELVARAEAACREATRLGGDSYLVAR